MLLNTNENLDLRSLFVIVARYISCILPYICDQMSHGDELN